MINGGIAVKKKLLRVGAVLLALLLIGVIVLAVMFFNDIRTLSTLKKINENDMFEMTYYSDYYFDEFLAQGGADDEDDLTDFLQEKLLKGLPINLKNGVAGCSCYMAHNEKGEVIYGRNFDFHYSPILVVHTHPKGGYASVAVADMAFAGYTPANLPKKDGISAEALYMMAAPYLCEDGMNEKGVAISIMTVPDANNPTIDGAPYLTTTEIVRLVLDKAANVDEAVELIRGCNFYWWGGIRNHLLISDASGRSVVVEFRDEEMVLIEPETDYQISTNYNFYDGLKRGNGTGRYDTIEKVMIENDGRLTEEQALGVLKDVGITGRIQWSSLYNLTTGDVCVFPRGKIESIERFKIDVTHDYVGGEN